MLLLPWLLSTFSVLHGVGVVAEAETAKTTTSTATIGSRARVPSFRAPNRVRKRLALPPAGSKIGVVIARPSFRDCSESRAWRDRHARCGRLAGIRSCIPLLRHHR